MGFFSALLTFFLLGDVAWWWRAHRSLRRSPRRRFWQIATGLFFLLQLVGLLLIIGSRATEQTLDHWVARPWLAAVYIWHCLMLLPLLAVWCVVALIGAIVRLVRWFSKPRAHTLPLPVLDSAPLGLNRREFLGTAVALAPAVLTLGAAGISAPQLERFRVRRIIVPLAALRPELDGFTIAQVSDVHVGRLTEGRVLDEIVAATNALDADLVLMTGDLINYSLRDLPVALDLVRALRARHGVFLCEGNHDLLEDGAVFERQVKEAGVPLLVNESAVLPVRGHSVQLLGLRWGGSRSNAPAAFGDAAIAASLRELLPTRNPAAFPILLAHHPHAFDFATDIPLTLAGHTHGGQLMLNEHVGFGPWMFRYWSGLYRREDRALVVSNGVGNWFPLRTHAPAEIVHLTLRATPPAARG